MFGWQSTQLGKTNAFKPVPPRFPFVQVPHVADNHWAVASTMTSNGVSCYKDTVAYYDSLRPLRTSPNIRKTICYFYKCDSSILYFHIVDVMRQPNSFDCGVFAAAIATEVAYNCDPAECRWDTSKMRQHLLLCLESGQMTRFPTVGKRRIAFGSRIIKSIPEELFCICRNEKTRPMIACDQCKKWFHKDCIGLDIDNSYKSEAWACEPCMHMLKQLQM